MDPLDEIGRKAMGHIPWVLAQTWPVKQTEIVAVEVLTAYEWFLCHRHETGVVIDLLSDSPPHFNSYQKSFIQYFHIPLFTPT